MPYYSQIPKVIVLDGDTPQVQVTVDGMTFTYNLPAEMIATSPRPVGKRHVLAVSEEWEPTQVPEDVQDTVNHILEDMDLEVVEVEGVKNAQLGNPTPLAEGSNLLIRKIFTVAKQSKIPVNSESVSIQPIRSIPKGPSVGNEKPRENEGNWLIP